MSYKLIQPAVNISIGIGIGTADLMANVMCICSIGKLWYRYNPGLLLCISHTSNSHYICTNELLQPNSGNSLQSVFMDSWSLSVRARHNLTCCIQSHSHWVWILELGLLPLFHPTILCEPRPVTFNLDPP